MKKYIEYAVVIAVAFLLSYVFIKPVNNIVNQTLGSVSGPDIYSPYINNNGVTSWYYSSALRSASTTCTFKSPTATTTIVSATAKLDSISALATTWELGVADTAFATTTVITRLSLGANTPGQIIATTSVSALTDGLVRPNTYINFKIATTTSTYTGWTPVGKCNLVLREL